MQKYEIFHGHTRFVLCTEEIFRGLDAETNRQSSLFSMDKANAFFSTENNVVNDYVLISENPERDWNLLVKELFKVIEAAGGLVKNSKDEILLIFRLGCWDLPKGKIDPGETDRDAAIREVEEETGAKIKNLKQLFATTYHTYRLNGDLILKKSLWYLMEAEDLEELIPQTAENIDVACWCPPEKIQEKYNNMYPSVKTVLEKYFD
ncbi:MAG: NUDIX domain-containing protein [Chitinophagaceae bacterium]|nr:MAG: NUDIX domain-containing protein [Chitinophagaceae bacterium]